MNLDNFKNNVRFSLSIFLTTILVIALIFLIFASIGTSFELDNKFWFRFITGAVITLLVVSIWLPSGKEKGEKDAVYISNKNAYDDRADLISKNQEHKKLRNFCKYKTQKKKEEKILAILGNVNLDYKDYETLLKSKATIEKIQENTEFNDNQKKVLIRLITKGVKVKPYNAEQITTGIENYKGDKLNNQEKIRQFFYMFSRIVISFGIMFFMASFVITEKSVTMADIAQLFIWLVAICTNLIGSYLYGIKLIVVFRNQYYIKLYNFLSEFDEWLANPENLKEALKSSEIDTKDINSSNYQENTIKCQENEILKEENDLKCSLQ